MNILMRKIGQRPLLRPLLLIAKYATAAAIAFYVPPAAGADVCDYNTPCER